MNTTADNSNTAHRRQAFGSLRAALYVIGFLLASIITIIALAWAVENWRGARAWAAAKRDLVARGEPLTFDQIVPPMPPDAQNFASTPLLRGLFDYDRSNAATGQ